MIDVIDMIPSKDLRQALRESGREFTDIEKATIVSNLRLPLSRQRELLQQIAAETDDELLREQVQWRMDKEQRILRRFQDEAEGFVFGVLVHDEDYPNSDVADAYFADYGTAYEFGVSTKERFRIQKWAVWQSVPDWEGYVSDGSCGSLDFDAQGELALVAAWIPEEEVPQFAPNIMEGKWPHYLFFEDRWIDLPNLYECGDIVHVVGDKSSYIDWAVVSVDREDWTALSKRHGAELAAVESGEYEPEGLMADYFDMQITVEFPLEDGTFTHDHISPMFLEKATEEAEGDEAELRQMATWTAQGDCGLELISTVLKKHILKNAQ